MCVRLPPRLVVGKGGWRSGDPSGAEWKRLFRLECPSKRRSREAWNALRVSLRSGITTENHRARNILRHFMLGFG